MQPVLRGAVALTALVVLTAHARAVAPPPAFSPRRVAALIKKLDADAFRTRQKADIALRALGPAVLPFVREELSRTRSPEVRHRLQLIEQHLTTDTRVSGLVQLLGHSDKRFRQHADVTLRNAGAAVVPLLKNELKADLSAQHRERLERLIDDLSEARPR